MNVPLVILAICVTLHPVVIAAATDKHNGRKTDAEGVLQAERARENTTITDAEPATGNVGKAKGRSADKADDEDEVVVEDVKEGREEETEAGKAQAIKDRPGKAEEAKEETVKGGGPEKTDEEKSGVKGDPGGKEIEEGGRVEGENEEEENEAPSGIRDPRPCEVCKYLAVELQGRLAETGKIKDYIVTGHGIMPGDRKKKDYRKSELRFIEALHEPHLCDKILEYDIHAERKKSLRYAKGKSETRKTLLWLRQKGVKVELGMPEEMWTKDAPPNEITHLQKLCIEMVERYEDEIEDWYWGYQEVHLLDFLCRQRALKTNDQNCLSEEYVPQEKKDEDSDSNTKKNEETDVDKSLETAEAKGDEGISSSMMPPTPPLTADSHLSSSRINIDPSGLADNMPSTEPPVILTTQTMPTASTSPKDEL